MVGSARADFTYDAVRNLYVCPQGKPLRTTGRAHDGRTILYRSQKVFAQATMLSENTPSQDPA